MKVQHEEPQAAKIVGVGLAMASVCLFSSFLSQSVKGERYWTRDIGMLIEVVVQRNFGQQHIHGGHNHWRHGVRLVLTWIASGAPDAGGCLLKLTPAVVVTLVYLDSFVFVVISSVLRFGLANMQMTASRCKTTDIVCLTIYLSTKVCHPHFTETPRLEASSADILH